MYRKLAYFSFDERSTFMCAVCQQPLIEPLQYACGDHVCQFCYYAMKTKGMKTFHCQRCNLNNGIDNFFRDKVIDKKLKSSIFLCPYSACSWKGKAMEYRCHIGACRYTPKYSPASLDLADSKDDPVKSSECLPSIKEDVFQNRAKATDKKIKALFGQMSVLEEDPSLQNCLLKGGITKVKTNLIELQEGFTELACTIQKLVATSYNGKFIWKIPEVSRRVQEAQAGGDQLFYMYSAPFYTSHYGYKIGLRLYINGNGPGKGTHLSLYINLLKGEYDVMLNWPFQQLVTMMLLDQNKEKDIVQQFRPGPASSSSSSRPIKERYLTWGLPKFAPLSVLQHSSYVKDDTMFFKVIVDTTGLNEI